jgi:hypothetical protein
VWRGGIAYGGGYLRLYCNMNGAWDTLEEIDPTTGALVKTVKRHSVGASVPLGGGFSTQKLNGRREVS